MKKICFIYFTYNRINILKESLRSSLQNTKIKPDKIFIFDDCSNEETQTFLKNFIIENPDLNITLEINKENKGYAANYKKVFKILKSLEYEYVYFLETDYIWRKGYLDECIELLETELDSVAICGSSFKEFYEKDKCMDWFSKISIEQFGKDVSNRSFLYKPKIIETKNFNIKIQYVTNCCGTFLFNAKRFFNNLNEKQINIFWEIMERASEVKNTKSVINDGMITGGISILWDEFLQKKFTEKNFEKSAFLDIIDYVIGVHVEGGGINGIDNTEGKTRYIPPNFPLDYNSFYRK